MGENASYKLMALAERFNGFEFQVKVEGKGRKDEEELKVQIIKDELSRLEQVLNTEVQRRSEANKALQGMFEAQMATVQDKLEAGLIERLDQLHGALDTLNDRVDNVEKDFLEARENYVRDIEDKSKMVEKDVSALQTAFQNERADRKERETLIVAKVRDLEERTAERFTQDKKILDRQHKVLQEELEVALHEDVDKRFQDHILEEMAALKNGLVLESQVREHADDDIVNAINHYTQAIQDALRAVNDRVLESLNREVL